MAAEVVYDHSFFVGSATFVVALVGENSASVLLDETCVMPKRVVCLGKGGSVASVVILVIDQTLVTLVILVTVVTFAKVVIHVKLARAVSAVKLIIFLPNIGIIEQTHTQSTALLHLQSRSLVYPNSVPAC